jgi:Flp pilus assembly protein TadG
MRLADMLRLARRFGRDRRGVSALEFALIAPVMIGTYFGLAEVADALNAKRRVSHAAAAMGDLVAQARTIPDEERDNVFAAAAALVAPYPAAPLSLRITSVTVDAKGKARADWTEATGSFGKIKRCDPVTGIPAGLITATGENLVRAEATYTYSSPVARILPDGVTFSEVYYLKPRKSTKVLRDGVPATACPA